MEICISPFTYTYIYLLYSYRKRKREREVSQSRIVLVEEESHQGTPRMEESNRAMTPVGGHSAPPYLNFQLSKSRQWKDTYMYSIRVVGSLTVTIDFVCCTFHYIYIQMYMWYFILSKMYVNMYSIYSQSVTRCWSTRTVVFFTLSNIPPFNYRYIIYVTVICIWYTSYLYEIYRFFLH